MISVPVARGVTAAKAPACHSCRSTGGEAGDFIAGYGTWIEHGLIMVGNGQ